MMAQSQKKDLVKEIATRAMSADYFSFAHYLPNPDPVLKKMGKDITSYNELLSDAHVAGCVRRRKAAVKSLEYRITETGNKQVDAYFEDLFNQMNLSRLINDILDATLYGYQPLEIIWQLKNSLYVPQQIISKPQQWFVFDDENNIKLRTKSNYFDGVTLPDYKFLLARQEPSYTNPYGRADLSLCFWPATFKKGGFKFWLNFVEKYGSPWVIGKHPRQSTDTETNDLLDSLESLIGTAVAAIPNDSSVEIVESAGKAGSSDAFNAFMKFCKAEIATALLGQNQTTEADANRASATAGLEVTEDIMWADADIVEQTINQLISYICELNFNTELPKFQLYEQEQIDKLQAERDVELTKSGAKLSNAYFARVYQLEEGDLLPQDETKQPLNNKEKKASDFSEQQNKNNPKKPIDHQIDLAEKTLAKPTDNWVKQIKAELAQAPTLEQFKQKLGELAPKLSIAEYAELLGNAKSASNLLGRSEVLDSAASKLTPKLPTGDS